MAKNKIHIKKSKVDSLHKHLGVPKGEKIPASKLKIKSTDSPAIRKKKQFAINSKKFHKHEDGGEIESYNEGLKDFLKSYIKNPNQWNFAPGGILPDNFGSRTDNDNSIPIVYDENGVQQTSQQNVDMSGTPLATPNIDFQNLINQSHQPQQQKPSFRNNMPPIYGSGPYFQQAGMEFSNAFNTDTSTGMGKAHAGLEAVEGIKDTTKGVFDLLGTQKQEKFNRNYNNNQLFDQLSGTERGGYSNFKPNDLHGEMAHVLQNKFGGMVYANGGKMQGANSFKDIFAEGGILPVLQNKMPQQDDVNEIKAPREMSNSEIEGGETVILPNGLIKNISGKDHEQGGIPVDAPGTRILSDRLKFTPKDKKSKTYAQEGKKYATDQDIESLNQKYVDDISKNTGNLNLKMKNEKINDIYAEQEAMKMVGAHGVDIQKKALGGFISKFPKGGETPYNVPNNDNTYYGQQNFSNDSIVNKFNQRQNLSDDDVPSLQNTAPINQTSSQFTRMSPTINYQGPSQAYANFKDMHQAAVKAGYKGPKTPQDVHNWQVLTNPNAIDEYMKANPQTNQGVQMFGKKGKAYDDPKYFNPLGNNYTRDERLMGYDDPYFDYRSPSMSNWKTPGYNPSTSQPQTGDVATFNSKKVGDGAKDTSKNGQFGILPVPAISAYAEDPLQTSQLNPHLINYRPTDIEGQIAESNRGFRALTKGLNTSPIGLSNTNNAFAQKLRGENEAFGQDFNRKQQGKMAVDEHNAQELSRVDMANLQERNRFMDLVNRGRGVIDTQKRTDQQGALENYYKANQYYNDADFINKHFGAQGNFYYNPSTQSLEPKNPDSSTKYIKTTDSKGNTTYKEETDTKKYGGKISSKNLLKKKKSKK